MASDLDDEIDSLKAQVASLKKQLKLQMSTLISSESTRQLLATPANTTTLTLPSEHNPFRQKLQSQYKAQEAHNQQCLYRTCATITTFRVRDPDPNAFDSGSVLGVRFEVMTRAKFIRPYYVMLNRPYADSRHLRVHRHTVPPCVPLPGLAARYLPPPPRASGEAGGGERSSAAARRQDLSRFVRALRRGIVRYHNRLAVIGDLRKAVGLDTKPPKTTAAPDLSVEGRITDVSAADAEAKQIKIEWADGRTGRLVMGDDGEVLRLVVFGEKGRDREATREFLGEDTRVEDIARRLGTA